MPPPRRSPPASLLDKRIGAYLAALTGAPSTDTGPGPAGLAIDGKTLRGSRTTDGAAVHLLSATLHHGQLVLAQRQIDAHSNEIGAFTPLLDHLDLARKVITADAMHTQHEHARHILARGGHYIFIVKANQPSLCRCLRGRFERVCPEMRSVIV
ncbi:ISAs1 family transposase [Sphaerimonospora cavernae]|uniref:ISAs1 family transposase n=1 Tax=Sphaerimonospora cavernae TaxID=1740611 RepID=A0ABV6U2L3_9ACTN